MQNILCNQRYKWVFISFILGGIWKRTVKEPCNKVQFILMNNVKGNTFTMKSCYSIFFLFGYPEVKWLDMNSLICLMVLELRKVHFGSIILM